MAKHSAEARVAYWIKRYRKERKITQDSLAARIKISRSSIPNWENRTYPVSIYCLENISKALGVHITLFFQDIPED